MPASTRRRPGAEAAPTGRPVPSATFEEVGLAAQEGPHLHGLAQRVDGGVGHLAGVEQQMVEDAQVGLVVAHAGELDPAGLGLLPDGLDERPATCCRSA